MPRRHPSGWSPRRDASAASMTTMADAPSDSCEALPAVMKAPSASCWPSRKTGCSPASPSAVVVGRTPSSASSVTALSLISPVSLSFTFITEGSGTISASNLPSAWAAAVRRCDSAAYSSCAWRDTPYLAATISAVSIIDIYTSGRCSLIHGSTNRCVFILSVCTSEIDSTPPPTPASISPRRTRSLTMASAISPDEHCLSTVMPGTEVGSPALISPWRATFTCVEPCCSAAPMTTSPISSAAMPAREIAWPMAWPASSWACVSLKAPR